MEDTLGSVRYPLTMEYNNGSVQVGINDDTPSYTFEVSGDAAKSTGTAWINTSDSRTKKNISPYTKGLDTIMNINPVYF